MVELNNVELYAVHIEPYEGPDKVTLFFSEDDAREHCPNHPDFRVVGPFVIGEERGLYY